MQSLSIWPISAAQLTDLINHHGTGLSYESPRYCLRDRTLAPINTGQSGITGDTSDITRYVQSGKIANDTTQAVHRSLDLVWEPIPGFSLDTLNTLIQVYWDYWDGNGNLIVEIPLGVFFCTLPDVELRDSGNLWKATWLDLTGQVNQLSPINTYVVPQGTNYVTAVTSLLTMDYIPLSLNGQNGLSGSGQTPAGLDDAGPAIPLSRITIPACSQVTPTSIPFTRKDGTLAAINSLLKAINYYPLWVDELGTFRSSPMPYYTTTVPAIGYTYNTDANSIIQAPIAQTFTNQADLANIVVVWAENNGTQTYCSFAYNTSASSLVSLPNMGRAIVQPIQDDTIPDQPTCDLRALIQLQYAAAVGERLQFTTTVNPLHQSHDYLAVNVTTASGVAEITTTGVLGFEETAWSIDLNTRLQSHDCSRMVSV